MALDRATATRERRRTGAPQIAKSLRWLVGIGILTLFLWPRYFYLNVGGRGVSAYTFFSMLLFVAALGTLALRPGIRSVVAGAAGRAWLIIAAFTLFWVWRIVCDVLGLTPVESYRVTLLDFLYLGTWFPIALVVMTDRRVQNNLPYLIAASAIVATAFGILEFMTSRALSDLLGFYQFAAGDQSQLGAVDMGRMRDLTIRVKSVFSHPIIYGQVLGSILPLAAHLVLQGRGVRRMIGGILGVCILISLHICNARSPLFVAATALVVYLAVYYLDFHYRRRLFVAAWLAIGALIVTPIATDYFLNVASGRTHDEATSSSARKLQSDKGYHALARSPINGFGDGNSLSIAGLRSLNNLLTVDNYYLTIVVDDGYVGEGIMILMFASFVLFGAVAASRERSSHLRGRSAAYTGAIAGLAAGLNVVSIHDTLSNIFLLAGAIIAQDRTGPAAIIRRSFPIPRPDPTSLSRDGQPAQRIDG
jgi:hypothetical protein